MARHIDLDHAQRRDWLRLIRAENVGPRAFVSLINRFGGAAPALGALPGLARRGGGLLAPRIPTIAEAEAEMAALARLGGRFVALGEAAYPALLRQIEDAPPLIAVRGRVELLNQPTRRHRRLAQRLRRRADHDRADQPRPRRGRLGHRLRPRPRHRRCRP